MLKRALLFVFLLLVLIIINAFLNPIPQQNTVEGFKPSYGFSYSFEQASWYGLDSRDAFIQLLDSVHFDWVRLPFFWDQMVLENGDLAIEDLKFAIGEAKKRNVKVVIALGAKTPYYPEYHLPKEVAAQIRFGETIGLKSPIAADILSIDEKLVSQLALYDNIVAWQVENEPYLANVNNWKIGKDLLSAEVDVVRTADPKKRPVIINHVAPAVFDWRYKSLVSILKPGDIFGVNAYFKTQGTYLASFKIFGNEVRISWPKWLVWPVQSWLGFSPDFERVKKEVAKSGIKLWVLEMQAEPYIRVRSDADKQKYYFDAADVLAAESYLRSSKMESVGLWGASFWHYRRKIGDDSWMDTVKAIVN